MKVNLIPGLWAHARKNSQSIKKKGDLPPLPEVLFSLEKQFNDPNSDVNSIAKLIDTEPVLAVKLVELANSVLFGGAREKAKDLPTVVLRLGLKTIFDLAYTLALPQMFERLNGFDQIRFWKHSLAVALLSRSLAIRLRVVQKEQRDFYLSGLVHDIGLLVFILLIPHEFSAFRKSAKESTQTLEKIERETFGISHSELGAEFLKTHWPVSQKVVLAATTHHQPIVINNSQDPVIKVVGAANSLAISHGIDHDFSPVENPTSNKELQFALGMSSNEIKALLEEVREGVANAEKLLVG